MSERVVRVNGLSKEYVIPVGGYHKPSFREALVQGIVDPVLKVCRRRTSQDGYQHLWALRDISFDVNAGEVVGIIGANGAGKSTLLKVLSRITAPTSGWVEMRGRVGSLLEVGTGFRPELTGLDNIYLNGAILGMRRHEIDAKLDEIVSFAEIAAFLNTPVKHYSSGMYIRLAFSVAAQLDPEIMIVDEVLAVGDVNFQRKCLTKMRGIASSGRTVFLVSHNLSAIAHLCTQVLWIDRGRLVMSGRAEHVIARYMEQGLGVSSGEKAWKEDERPGDDTIRLCRAGLSRPDGTVTGQAAFEDGFWVETEYDVLKPSAPVRVLLWLNDPFEQKIFATSDADASETGYEAREPGRYRARVRVPGGWLKPGEYHLGIAVVRSNGQKLLNAERIVRLQVQANLLPQGEDWHYRMGFVTPVLPWTTERVRA